MALSNVLYIEKAPIMVCICTGTLLDQELGNLVGSGQFKQTETN